MNALLEEPLQTYGPLEFRLSFWPFLRFLKKIQHENETNATAPLYAYLVGQFEQAQSLARLTDEKQIEARLQDCFRLATTVLLPLATNDRNVPYAFGLPDPIRLYYRSAAFGQLTEKKPSLLTEQPDDVSQTDQLRFVYQKILQTHYGIDLPSDLNTSFQFQRTDDGFTRFYQLDTEISFIEPVIHGDLPALQTHWVAFAFKKGPIPVTNPLPIKRFTFEGFVFFRVNDVTQKESLAQLRELFIHLPSVLEPAVYERFETALRNLCGKPGLQVGITALPKVNGQNIVMTDNPPRSVYLRTTGLGINDLNESMSPQAVEAVLNTPEPYILNDLTGLTDPQIEALFQRGLRSYLVYPIARNETVLGVLEMASTIPNAFDDDVLEKIGLVLPLIQELLRYQLLRFDEQLEGYIKTTFTPLQPAVSWKFYEAAWQEMNQPANQRGDVAESTIRFEKVHPFYGAIDIRNSSAERCRAVRQDLLKQLTAAQMELHRVTDQSGTVQDLWEASRNWHQKLHNGMNTEDELAATTFLSQVINPYLQDAVVPNPNIAHLNSSYFARINPVTGIFEETLSQYDQAMNRLNTVINTYIDQEEIYLQTIYPHYFERYRTDGAEYTLYVGQSIAPKQAFDSAVLDELHRWQLRSMVELARLTHLLQPSLPVRLQTTQLLLAHIHPVDIGFRRDERRFDVEGSYSIRYEVIKKRIDKACIKHTQERLTQPGMIAIVYSHPEEIVSYLPIIAELQAQGQLDSGIAYFDLEAVQSLGHLKAIRLRINLTAEQAL